MSARKDRTPAADMEFHPFNRRSPCSNSNERIEREQERTCKCVHTPLLLAWCVRGQTRSSEVHQGQAIIAGHAPVHMLAQYPTFCGGTASRKASELLKPMYSVAFVTLTCECEFSQ